MENKLQNHSAKWEDCKKCPLGSIVRKHVLYDFLPATAEVAGKVDVMIIGEGPGESEDMLGKPFVGTAGRLLRDTISVVTASYDLDNISEEAGGPLTVCLTNLIACRPQDKFAGRNRVPRPTEVYACSDRLEELVALIKPSYIICTGNVPLQYIPNMLRRMNSDIEYTNIPHPSYIRRTGGTASDQYPRYCQRLGELFTHAVELRDKEEPKCRK